MIDALELNDRERNNRETWLNRAMVGLRATFKHAGLPLDMPIRISVGFCLGGFEKLSGQCFKKEVSRDGTNEIFVSPLIDDAVAALGTLAHELIHASDNGKSKHGAAFARNAATLGLEGKPTQAGEGPEFAKRYAQLLRDLGPYPHAALRPSKIKRQATRLRKVTCPECGYIARVTSKWLDDAGAPICPTDEIPMEVAE